MTKIINNKFWCNNNNYRYAELYSNLTCKNKLSLILITRLTHTISLSANINNGIQVKLNSAPDSVFDVLTNYSKYNDSPGPMGMDTKNLWSASSDIYQMNSSDLVSSLLSTRKFGAYKDLECDVAAIASYVRDDSTGMVKIYKNKIRDSFTSGDNDMLVSGYKDLGESMSCHLGSLKLSAPSYYNNIINGLKLLQSKSTNYEELYCKLYNILAYYTPSYDMVMINSAQVSRKVLTSILINVPVNPNHQPINFIDIINKTNETLVNVGNFLSNPYVIVAGGSIITISFLNLMGFSYPAMPNITGYKIDLSALSNLQPKIHKSNDRALWDISKELCSKLYNVLLG